MPEVPKNTRTQSQDFPTDPVLPGTMLSVREVLGMTFPVIISLASISVMGFVDYWMVSQVSQEAAAAVAPSGIIVFTFVSFFTGVLSCTNTFVSQSYARHEPSVSARYVWQGLYIALIAGVGAFALWPLVPKVFAFLNHGQAIESLEVTYAQIRLASVGMMAGTVALSGFYQGIGKPWVAMVASVAGNVFNVVANYVLIFGKLGFPRMGVAGAALGTVLASGFQLGILVTVFLSPWFDRTFNSRRMWRWNGHAAGRLFHIGWPSGVSFMLEAGTWGVFIAWIMGRLGLVALAANGIAGQIFHISFMPTVGLSIGTTALVGRYVGKRDFRTARERARTALFLGMGYMFCMGAGFFIFRHQLIRMFRSEPDIVAAGAQIMVFGAVFQVFDAMGIVSSGALKGAGDTRFPAVMSVALGWGLFLPAAWFMTGYLSWGIPGAWLAGCVYIIILGVAMLWRWRSGAWTTIDIFQKAPDTKPAELTLTAQTSAGESVQETP